MPGKRDAVCAYRHSDDGKAAAVSYVAHTADRWHPAVRLLIIIGSASSLWMLVLAAIT